MLKLVPEWRKAWRWFSMQSMVVTLAILGAWGAMPDDLKAAIPGSAVLVVAMSVLTLGIAGRLVKQK